MKENREEKKMLAIKKSRRKIKIASITKDKILPTYHTVLIT